MINRTFADMQLHYDDRNRQASRRGQVAVEYVLLLAIGVTIAALVTSLVVSRNEDKPGFLILKWRQITTLIGTDKIDQ